MEIYNNLLEKGEKYCYLVGSKKTDNEVYAVIELRNKIVHNRYLANEDEARNFLKFVEKVKDDIV